MNDKYFDSDNKLKSAYYIYYSSRPNWSEIPKQTIIVIDKEYNIEINLVWYKILSEKRIITTYSNNLLPENIAKSLNEIDLIDELELKKIYSSKIEKYAPEGISEDWYQINHSSSHYTIDMSSYWIDESLFKTQAEKLFLKLHKEFKVFKDMFYEQIVNLNK